MPMPFMHEVTQLAGAIGSITVIGGALIWIYKKLVVEPDNRLAKKLQDDNNRLLKDTVTPLTHAIEQLNQNLDYASQEQKQIRHNVEVHEGRLDAHETRITVLETKGELK